MPLDGYIVLAIVGLAVVTVITRSFFFFSNQDWKMPVWAQRGLQYAPIAALSAVIAPEIVMTNGQLIETFLDARLYAVLAAALAFHWKRDVLITAIIGMTVYLPLHVGLGW